MLLLMKNFNLNPEELQSLRVVHKLTRDKWAADRIKALLALGGGWTLEEVSEILLLDTETLRNYIKLYQQGGVEELTQRHYKGSVGKLSEIEREELKAHLSEITYLSVMAVAKYIEKTYEVKYTVSGLRDLLHNLGFVYKKPDIAPGRVDAVKQLEFLQKFEEMRRSGNPVYSMDGCHPQHNSMPQYGWILKGHTKTLPSNSGRKRINIQGAVNLDTHALLSTVHETLDKDSTIELLKKIEKENKSASKIYTLVDNAGYYHAKEVMKYLENSKIELVFLPAYAPHLSLVERVWRYLKKQVLYNRYYPTFQEFKEEILNFLNRSHRRAFKTLLTEKFHFARPKTSMMQLSTA
jgi:transposase